MAPVWGGRWRKTRRIGLRQKWNVGFNLTSKDKSLCLHILSCTAVSALEWGSSPPLKPVSWCSHTAPRVIKQMLLDVRLKLSNVRTWRFICVCFPCLANQAVPGEGGCVCSALGRNLFLSLCVWNSTLRVLLLGLLTPFRHIPQENPGRLSFLPGQRMG